MSCCGSGCRYYFQAGWWCLPQIQGAWLRQLWRTGSITCAPEVLLSSWEKMPGDFPTGTHRKSSSEGTVCGFSPLPRTVGLSGSTKLPSLHSRNSPPGCRHPRETVLWEFKGIQYQPTYVQVNFVHLNIMLKSNWNCTCQNRWKNYVVGGADALPFDNDFL